MKCYLTNFQQILPKYLLSQEKSVEWIAKAHALAEASHLGWSIDSPKYHAFYEEIQRRLFTLGAAHKKIEKRGFQIPDIVHERFEEMSIYPSTTHPEGRAFQERTTFFQQNACSVFEEFYPKEKEMPEHLIHVTCTGYFSPNAAQCLVAKRSSQTTITNAYHMGCYASLPALRMTQGMKGADIVHTEMCTLHMNPLLHSTEQLVIHTLFADGFVKYSISQEIQEGLQLLALHEELIPDSTSLMSWGCASWGMRMTLLKEVPTHIAVHLPHFLERLMEKTDVKAEDALFAIHPGGPKIIQKVAEILQLSKEQTTHSQAVLRERGNMSSATLPLIWMRMLQDREVINNTPIISLAFGPGLTLSGAVFKKCTS